MAAEQGVANGGRNITDYLLIQSLRAHAYNATRTVRVLDYVYNPANFKMDSMIK